MILSYLVVTCRVGQRGQVIIRPSALDIHVMKAPTDPPITELSGLFDALSEDHGQVADLLAKSIHQLKETLADETIPSSPPGGPMFVAMGGLKILAIDKAIQVDHDGNLVVHRLNLYQAT